MIPQPSENVIQTMTLYTWILYIVAWILCISPISRGIGTLIDTVSIIIAFSLVSRQETEARSAGWVRLRFELVTWLIAFSVLELFIVNR